MNPPAGVRKFGGSYYVDLNDEEFAELRRKVNGVGDSRTCFAICNSK